MCRLSKQLCSARVVSPARRSRHHLRLCAHTSARARAGAYDHEARHRTLFASRAANDLFGHVFAFMTNFEPVRWRWTHTLHHAYTLSTAAPLDFEIQVERPTQLLRLFVGSFVPFGPLLFVHQSYLADTFRCALGRESLLPAAVRECVPLGHGARRQVVRMARVHAGVWAALALWCFAARSWLPALYFMLPTFYGNTLFALCGLSQHAGLPLDVKDHRLNTRTVRLNPLLSWLYVKLEYHQEHHMFPFVPWHKLPHLHTLLHSDPERHQMPPPYDGLLAAWQEIVPAVCKQAFKPDYVPPSRVPGRSRSTSNTASSASSTGRGSGCAGRSGSRSSSN